MKLNGGIDLHSNNHVAVLSDEEDEVVYRRRLPSDIGVVLAKLAPFRDHMEGSGAASSQGRASFPSGSPSA